MLVQACRSIKLLLSPYRSDECSGDEYVVEDECDHTDGASGAICSASCCKNATYVPVQVTDPGTLLKTKKLQGKKWRQFNSDWFKVYPWLVLCTTKRKAFCSYCRYSSERGLLTEKKGREVLYSIHVGFDNWKKAHETFSHHQQSCTHREAVLKHELKQQASIEAQLSDSV